MLPREIFENQMRLYAFSCNLRDTKEPVDGYILMNFANRIDCLTSKRRDWVDEKGVCAGKRRCMH